MEIELNTRWRPNTETNGHLSPRSETNIHHMTSSRPTLFFITHYLQHLITEENSPLYTEKDTVLKMQKKYSQK